ncbi:regulation of nuclear pre-mRNA domain-containing protein 1B-like [Tachyglossus aculeatus]|uniref:regulation of nuclear pre-mRNA domain-containing protein 1B-like n=1 Tax=Tachyglossus aculeatus TaxID=9261 RepID=UPI0018F3B6CC|nr:regulation of nuclear pre-mRNA domain-containing protein 1B-like [Tachyglossus aculeatus]
MLSPGRRRRAPPGLPQGILGGGPDRPIGAGGPAPPPAAPGLAPRRGGRWRRVRRLPEKPAPPPSPQSRHFLSRSFCSLSRHLFDSCSRPAASIRLFPVFFKTFENPPPPPLRPAEAAMASFAKTVLVEKLAKLQISQQSIVTLSQWVLQFRQNACTIVSVWLQQFRLVNPGRKIILLYLANDVLQNGRKGGPEFLILFATVLQEAARLVAGSHDEECRACFNTLLDIWQDRKVYIREFIQNLRLLLEDYQAFPPRIPEGEQPPERRTFRMIQESEPRRVPEGPSQPCVLNLPLIEETIKGLQNLRQSASVNDTEMPELPPEDEDISLAEQVNSRSEAENLAEMMEKKCVALLDYNNVLGRNIDEQHNLVEMMLVCTQNQYEVLIGKEKKYEDIKKKYLQAAQLCNQLRKHVTY